MATPRRASRWFGAALALAALALPAAATPEQAANLGALAAEDRRVATVSFRLLAAGVPVCTETAPASGLTVHEVRQYAVAMRPEATRMFGFAGRPTVAAVVPGGPADRAGIRPGDTILAIGGVGVAAAPTTVPDRRKPSHDAAAAVETRLAAAMAQGPVELALGRDGGSRAVRLVPVAACASPVQLQPGATANAWSDGRGVAVTTALVETTIDDDELATLIGHEIAHNILRHRAVLEAQGVGTGLLSRIGAKADKVRETEREADRVGLYLAARAGYDAGAAVRFWARFGAGRGGGIFADRTHPGWRERVRSLEQTAAAIAARQARGEPVVPPTPTP